MAVHRAVDVRRLLPARAHGLGHRRLHERRVERRAPASRRSTSRAARSSTCRRAGRRSSSASSSASAPASASAPSCPHSLVLTMVGTGMLWVGWYGFNAGSAVAADGIAANAFTTTTLAAAVAAACGRCSSGSRAASPPCSASARAPSPASSSSRRPPASSRRPARVIIGVLAGVVPFLACTKLKAIFKYDDALDTFGVHGVGGTLGAFVTGIFATPEVNAQPQHQPRAALVGKTLWLEQLKAIGLTLALVGRRHGRASRSSSRRSLGLRPERRGRRAGSRRHRSRRSGLSSRRDGRAGDRVGGRRCSRRSAGGQAGRP